MSSRCRWRRRNQALPIIKTQSQRQEAKDEPDEKPKTPMKSEEADGEVSEDADTEEASGLDPEEVRLRWRIRAINLSRSKDLLATHDRDSDVVKAGDEWACQLLYALFKLNSRVSDNIMNMMREVYERRA